MIRIVPIICMLFVQVAFSQHNSGRDCFSCHNAFHNALKIGGTVYSDSAGTVIAPDQTLSITSPNGNTTVLENSNGDGNYASTTAPDGSYIMRLGSIASRTWHLLPAQKSCNVCHIAGGAYSASAVKSFPRYHTAIPSDNNCANCHHFPASMQLTQLKTPGVLSLGRTALPPDTASYVVFGGTSYLFNPAQLNVVTLRPDIFAPGYYSMFDVILAVAAHNNIPVQYHWDDSCKTHFITSMNGTPGQYWYHFSYDAGSQTAGELQYRRANRWDEALWRTGVQVRVVNGEPVDSIRLEYLEEIQREKSMGHVIPSVTFAINPSSYQGNPTGSGRVTVTRNFTNLAVTAHNWRSTGHPSPYSKPFQPGVVTSLDIPLSLMDQGQLDMVTGVFYNHFASNYIESYYVVELGFPGTGSVHSSGRQGIVYVTENGAYNNLPNRADNKLHMTSDIHVIHAPDFSYWRWIELGNPYYETQEPSAVQQSIEEDFNSLSRGFNLHKPMLKTGTGEALISFNIFHPGVVDLSVFDFKGRKVTRLFSGKVQNLGVHKFVWRPRNNSSGRYVLKMRYNGTLQERNLIYLK